MSADLRRQTIELPVLTPELKKLVTVLLRAMALHSPDKVGHSQRVSRDCHQLAFRFGLSAAERMDLYLASRLHDIGVIGVSRAILDKPGPLDPPEREEMNRHVEHARRVLIELPKLQKASRIIHCHHEQWDGSGYPRGLKGQRIPIGARILAVVDVWDALQSERPYRAAWSRAEANTYLHTQAGAQFDPEVAAAFLEMVH